MKKFLLWLILILFSSPAFAGQLTLENLDTMGQARNNINSNFDELYGQAFDAMLVSIAALTDPGVDKLMMWDVTTGGIVWLTLGDGLTISGTTIIAQGLGDVAGPGSSLDGRFTLFDGTDGKTLKQSYTTEDSSGNVDVVGDISVNKLTVLPENGSNIFTLVENTIPVEPTDNFYQMYVEDNIIKINNDGVETPVGGVVVSKVVTTADYTVGTDDPREAYGGVIYVTQAGRKVTAPPAKPGMNFKVKSTLASTIYAATDVSDKAILDGADLGDNAEIDSPGSALGEYANFTYYDTTGWYVETNSWGDGGDAATDCMTGTYILAWTGDHDSGENYACTDSGTSTIAGVKDGLLIDAAYGETGVGAYTHGTYRHTTTEKLTWQQTVEQYFDSTAEQTLWVRIYVTILPGATIPFIETAADGNNYITLYINSSGELGARFRAAGTSQNVIYDTAVTIGSWIDVAYSYNEAGTLTYKNHSLNVGDSWGKETLDGIKTDMSLPMTEFSLGNYWSYVPADGTVGAVYVDKWALVDGYQAVKPSGW